MTMQFMYSTLPSSPWLLTAGHAPVPLLMFRDRQSGKILRLLIRIASAEPMIHLQDFPQQPYSHQHNESKIAGAHPLWVTVVFQYRSILWSELYEYLITPKEPFLAAHLFHPLTFQISLEHFSLSSSDSLLLSSPLPWWGGGGGV
jgi:hypothetical protein